MVVASNAPFNTKSREIENKISDIISFIIIPEFNRLKKIVFIQE